MPRAGTQAREGEMAGVEVKTVNLLGMPVPYAYAVKAGMDL
jgi:hypothetical protein